MEKEWKVLETSVLCDAGLFRIERLRSRRLMDGRESRFYRMVTRDWVNVVPITRDGKVVLIRQFRQGIQDWTIEIPGGVLEPGETPLQGAIREMEEETGYISQDVRILGKVHPNPALQSNVCHFALALDAWPGGHVNFDPDENIEIILATPEEAWRMARDGSMTNVMAVAALAFALDELR